MEDFNRGGDRRGTKGYYSRKLRAGKRRTYFFDVKATKGQDYYITITESKRRHNHGGYDSHKVFLYKEDFLKFAESLQEAIDHIKGECMPDFDWENYTREKYYQEHQSKKEDYHNRDSAYAAISAAEDVGETHNHQEESTVVESSDDYGSIDEEAQSMTEESSEEPKEVKEETQSNSPELTDEEAEAW